MDPRRLQMLLELAELGSMRQVADSLGVTTSTVSQQLRLLGREAGTVLLEADGRRVRLTPAGQRLARHAVIVLAAIEAARADVDPGAPPAGTVRVAAYASAVRELLLPMVRLLRAEHPRVRLEINEHEPNEAMTLLAADEVDLALAYDYNLAPRAWERRVSRTALGTTPWALGVPERDRAVRGAAAEVFAHFWDSDWIVNSRNAADDEVLRVLASTAGFEPRVTQRADSLELVQDMIRAGLGVGLLPATQPVLDGVALIGLRDPGVLLRGFALVRRGRQDWPALRLVLELLRGLVDEPDP